MKFTMNVEDANRLCAIAKAEEVGKNTYVPNKFMYIQCRVKDGILKAQAVHGASMSQVRFAVQDADDGEYFLAPPQKKFTKCDRVFVEDDEKETTYISDTGGKVSYPKNHKILSPATEFTPFDFCVPPEKEVKASYYVNAERLADVLMEFSEEAKKKRPVRLDFVQPGQGSTKSVELWIYDESGNRSVVLPIRVEEEKKAAWTEKTEVKWDEE